MGEGDGVFVWAAAFTEGAVAFAEGFAVGLVEIEAELVFSSEEIFECEIVWGCYGVCVGALLGGGRWRGCGALCNGCHVAVTIKKLCCCSRSSWYEDDLAFDDALVKELPSAKIDNRLSVDASASEG